MKCKKILNEGGVKRNCEFEHVFQIFFNLVLMILFTQLIFTVRMKMLMNERCAARIFSF